MVNGVRTHPVIPRSVAMNRSQLKKFEIRLGLIQTVSLVAVVLGFLGGAFFLGFSSGKTTGHDLAYQSSIATSARIPLSPKGEKPSASAPSAQAKVDVYADLQGAPKVKVEEEPKAPQMAASDGKPKEPEVSTIPEVKIPAEDPIEQRLAANLKVNEASQIKESSPEIKGEILGTSLLEKSQGAGVPSTATLGDVSPKKILDGAVPLHDPKAMRSDEKGEHLLKASSGAQATDTTVGRVVFSDSQATGGAARDSIAAQKSSAAQEVQGSGSARIEIKEENPVLVAKKEEVPVKKAELPPVSAAVAEKPSKIASSTKGWFAQVAAPQKSSDAQQLSAQLRASGFRVTIENATVRGEEYYRVLVGPEGSIEQAQRLVEQLRRESYLQTQPFVRLVK